MKRSALFLVFAVFIVGFLVLPPGGYAAGIIKLGIVDTYSGPAATMSQDVLDGFKLVANEVNAQGGIKGRKIEFVVRDDKFKADIGLALAKELVLKEKTDRGT